MSYKEFKKLVKKHGGWIEDDEVARFPTPHQKDQFLKELNGT